MMVKIMIWTATFTMFYLIKLILLAPITNTYSIETPWNPTMGRLGAVTSAMEVAYVYSKVYELNVNTSEQKNTPVYKIGYKTEYERMMTLDGRPCLTRDNNGYCTKY